MESNEISSIETESTFFRYSSKWHGKYWNLSVLCGLVQRELKPGFLVSIEDGSLKHSAYLKYTEIKTSKFIYNDNSLVFPLPHEVNIEVPKHLKSDDRDCVVLYAQEWDDLHYDHDKLNLLEGRIKESLHDEIEVRFKKNGEIDLYNSNDRRSIRFKIDPWDFYSYMTYGVPIPVPIPMRFIRKEAL